MTQHSRFPKGSEDIEDSETDYLPAWDWIVSLLQAAGYMAGTTVIGGVLFGMAYAWWMN